MAKFASNSGTNTSLGLKADLSVLGSAALQSASDFATSSQGVTGTTAMSQLVSHRNRADNPHVVTLAQVGAASAAQGAKADNAVLQSLEVDLGSVSRNSGSFNITGQSGLTPGNPAEVFQLPGPYTGKGTLADEAEMDHVSVAASCLSGSVIQCFWNATGAIVGNFKFAYRF